MSIANCVLNVFLQMIGGIDINNLTDDFVEDVMLQSKPLQGILMGIRLRQAVSTFCFGAYKT